MITDEMLAEATAEVNDAMLKSLPNESECDHQFSHRFERKMKSVIRRAEHPTIYRIVYRAACLLLILVFSFTTILAVSPTARAAFFGWIKETYESFVNYHLEDTESNNVSNLVYRIEELPPEYTEIAISEDVNNYMGIYADPDGNLLYFSYSTSPDTAYFSVKAEGATLLNVSVAGNPADLYLSEDSTKSNCIIWCDEENNAILYISAMLDKDMLLKLAESVSQK